MSTRLRARSRGASSQSSPPVACLDALTPATGLFNKKSKSWGVIGAMSAASPRAPTAGAGSSDAGRTVVAPSSRNELMLIDAAPETHGYASDLTRTYPVNGKYYKSITSSLCRFSTFL